MNKKFLTLLTTGAAIFALASCAKTGKDGVYNEYDFRGTGYLENDYFALKNMFYNLKVGESKTIEVETFPASYAANSLEYISNDPSVVSVDASGKLTGVGKGIADVTVKAKDESIVGKVRVAVSEKVSASAAQSVIDNINEGYAEGYVAPRKCIKYEYSYEIYSKEGVRDHGMENYEAMAFDMDTGYFKYVGPSLYLKTAHGTPEVLDGSWIFYPINYGLFTRLIHITPTKKNYFDINTAAYEGDYDRIIKDILNFFFVSGEEIASDLIDYFDGKDNFESISSYSATSFYTVDENSLVMSLSEKDSDVVEAKDELKSFDIPTDTVYNYVFNETVLHSNNRMRAMNIDMVMSYKLGEENWTREFGRFELYDDEFDQSKIQNPKDNGFISVDSIYDL